MSNPVRCFVLVATFFFGQTGSSENLIPTGKELSEALETGANVDSGRVLGALNREMADPEVFDQNVVLLNFLLSQDNSSVQREALRISTGLVGVANQLALPVPDTIAQALDRDAIVSISRESDSDTRFVALEVRSWLYGNSDGLTLDLANALEQAQNERVSEFTYRIGVDTCCTRATEKKFRQLLSSKNSSVVLSSALILLGAGYYDEAVASAFKQILESKSYFANPRYLTVLTKADTEIGRDRVWLEDLRNRYLRLVRTPIFSREGFIVHDRELTMAAFQSLEDHWAGDLKEEDE